MGRRISEKTRVKIDTLLELNKGKLVSVTYVSDTLGINKNTVRKIFREKVKSGKLAEFETVTGRKYYADKEEVLRKVWK